MASKPTLWIDADAAPRDAKELVYRASSRLDLAVVLVANQSISVPPGQVRIRCITVRDGANEADKYIVEQSQAGDIVITADIPLAAQLVAKGVYVIEPRGEEFHEGNMAGRLAARDFLDAARGAGMELTGPSPYGPKDRSQFASTLDRVLTRCLKDRK